jgi:hypothetical protein
MVEREPRYRNAWLKAGCNKPLLRRRVVAPSPVPTNKSHPQLLTFFFHHLVSTYFGGHLMPQRSQWLKVRGNSRLHLFGDKLGLMFAGGVVLVLVGLGLSASGKRV